MTIDSVQIQSNSAYQVGPSGDNEAAERVPDNEAAEISRSAQSTSSADPTGGLAAFQGQIIDTYA